MELAAFQYDCWLLRGYPALQLCARDSFYKKVICLGQKPYSLGICMDSSWPVMREVINLLVLPLLALIMLALYFYPDQLENLISWVDNFFRS